MDDNKDGVVQGGGPPPCIKNNAYITFIWWLIYDSKHYFSFYLFKDSDIMFRRYSLQIVRQNLEIGSGGPLILT